MMKRIISEAYERVAQTARRLRGLIGAQPEELSMPRSYRPAPPPPPPPPRISPSPLSLEREMEMEDILVEELWNLPLDEAEKSLNILVAPPLHRMMEAELPQLSREEIREKVRVLLVQERSGIRDQGSGIRDEEWLAEPEAMASPEPGEVPPSWIQQEVPGEEEVPVPEIRQEALEFLQEPSIHEPREETAVEPVREEKLPEFLEEGSSTREEEVSIIGPEPPSLLPEELPAVDLVSESTLQQAAFEPTPEELPVPGDETPFALPAPEAFLPEMATPPTPPDSLPPAVVQPLPEAAAVPSPLDALAQAMAYQTTEEPALQGEPEVQEPLLDLSAVADETPFFAEEAAPALEWSAEKAEVSPPEIVEADTGPQPLPEPAPPPSPAAAKSSLEEELSDYWGSFLLDEKPQAPAEPAGPVPSGPAGGTVISPEQVAQEYQQWDFLYSEQLDKAPAAPPLAPGPLPVGFPTGEDLAVFDASFVPTELPRNLRLPPRRLNPFRPKTAGEGVPELEGDIHLWDNVVPVLTPEGAPVPATLPVSPAGFQPRPPDESPRSTAPLALPSRPGTAPLHEAPPLETMFPAPLPGEEEEAGLEEFPPARGAAPARSPVRLVLLMVPLLVLSLGGTAYSYFLLYQPAQKRTADLTKQLNALRSQIIPSPAPTPIPPVAMVQLLEEVKDFNLIGDPDYLFTSDKRVSEQLARLHHYIVSVGAQLASVEIEEVAAPKATPTPAPTPSPVQLMGKGKKEPATGKTKGGPIPAAIETPAPPPAPQVDLLTRQVKVTVIGPYKGLVAVIDFLHRQPVLAHLQQIEITGKESTKGGPVEEPTPAKESKPKKPAPHLLEAKMTLSYYFLYSTVSVGVAPSAAPGGSVQPGGPGQLRGPGHMRTRGPTRPGGPRQPTGPAGLAPQPGPGGPGQPMQPGGGFTPQAGPGGPGQPMQPGGGFTPQTGPGGPAGFARPPGAPPPGLPPNPSGK